MHDIKFRAWDNLEKRMRKVVSLHWQGDKLVSARLEGENEPIPIEGRLMIEEYTNLDDPEHISMYENDIVEVTSTYHDFGLGVMKWDYNSARFGVSLKEDGYQSEMCYEIDHGRSELKVVGNIHENPELLEEK